MICNINCVNLFSTGGEETSDEMKKLEEKARQLAEESMKDQNKPEKGILFVRLVQWSLIIPLAYKKYVRS